MGVNDYEIRTRFGELAPERDFMSRPALSVAVRAVSGRAVRSVRSVCVRSCLSEPCPGCVRLPSGTPLIRIFRLGMSQIGDKRTGPRS